MTKDQCYLKCEYYPGRLKEENVIKFEPYKKKPGNQGWCLVNKEDVLVVDSDKNKGLVKIVVVSIEGDKALVGINDTSDHKESRYEVSTKDISKNRSSADQFRNNLSAPYLSKHPLKGKYTSAFKHLRSPRRRLAF